MFSFLNKFFLDTKKKHFLIRYFNIWNYNFLNYKNYKISSFLLVLINQFSVLDSNKVLILSSLFSNEIFVKRWFFTFIFLFILVLFVI